MAKPRIFISSTFYDLKHVRADLDRFVKDLGYDAIRNETGSIPYGRDSSPEDYAYKELELCDIIVSIIGGRYGSDSRSESGYSITQNELKRALDKGIQVFIFIEKGVLSEYWTYTRNKDNKDINYHYIDNRKIFEFIDFIQSLTKNNPIAPFETSLDIIEYLKIQWAGLFQRFLQEQQRMSEKNVLDEMKSVAATLEQLVEYLSHERDNRDEAIQSILLANHPAFRRFARVTLTPHRIFFANESEMRSLLDFRGWQLVSEDVDLYIYRIEKESEIHELYINRDIFDEDGKLNIYTEDEWNDDWVFKSIERNRGNVHTGSAVSDDDLPF